MTPQVREHIFEPSFTTKEEGKEKPFRRSTLVERVRQILPPPAPPPRP